MLNNLIDGSRCMRTLDFQCLLILLKFEINATCHLKLYKIGIRNAQ